ncbi:MAG: DUF2085 domain-containing protein [Chloroflexi bacterium]|nr:DUF2085 domain-containing protein [Chloroflexota bacterium]
MKNPLPGSSWKWLPFITAGLVLAVWAFYTPDGLLGKADAIAYSVCHRIDAHSLHFGNRQLPLCARCTGMYLGALLGLVYQTRIPKRGGFPTWKMALPFGAFFLAFALDGVNSYLHFFPDIPGLYTPSNSLRLATGTGMGLSIAVILLPAFRQTYWVDWQDHPLLSKWSELGALVLLAAVMDLAVLTENPLLVYPLALLSALGVVVVLALVYSMLVVMILRIENRFSSIRQVLAPLAAGFSVALIQVGAIDWLRFFFTGSWQGFHL